MTAWWLLSVAWGAPVLGPPVDELDPVQACVEVAGERVDEGPRLHELSDVRQLAIVAGVPCHHHPSVPSLAYASRDALRMAEALEARGFTVVRLTTLVTRDQLLDAVSDARHALHPDGELLVYVSGHGVLREEGTALQRYLVLSDTDLTDVGRTGLRAERLESLLDEVPAGRRVLVQDTCFASQPTTAPTAPDGQRAKAALLPAPPPAADDATLRLYASRFFEQATESVQLQGSLYTHHLLAALDADAADLDGNACVDLLEAHEHARQATSAARHGFQNPTASWSDLHHIRGTLDCTQTGTQAVLARADTDRAFVDQASTPPLAAVAPGPHQVVWDPGDRPRQTHWQAQPGAWVDARDLTRRPPPELHLRAGVRSRLRDGLPLALAAVEAVGQVPMGRMWTELAVSAATGPRYDTDTACLGYQASDVELRAAGLASAGPLRLGPSLGVGALQRRSTDHCRDVPLAAGWGTQLTAGLSGTLTAGALSVGLHAGVDALYVDRDDGTDWAPVPRAQLTVGRRW